MHYLLSGKYIFHQSRFVFPLRTASSWAHCLASLAPKYASAHREDLFPGCYVVHNLLSPSECKKLIDCAENRVGYTPALTDYPPSYRNNDRLIVDDDELAIALFDRAKEYLPSHVKVSQKPRVTTNAKDSELWQLKKINPRLRACRYQPDQYFNRHRDGVFFESPDSRSFLTFMVYLDEPPAFAGGDTVFEVEAMAADDDASPDLISVTPRQGSMIIFQHDVMHWGAVCTGGCKHLMRSDVIYQRLCAPTAVADGSDVTSQLDGISDVYEIIDNTKPPPSNPQAHLGYVWDLLQLQGGTLASCSRDNTIKLWRKVNKDGGMGFELKCIATLNGHTRSPLSMTELTSLSSPNALTFVSASRDRSIRIWRFDMTSGHTDSEPIFNAHDGSVLMVAAVCGDSFVSGGADGALYRWNAKVPGSTAAGWMRSRVGSHNGWVRSLVVSQTHTSNGSTKPVVVSGGEDGMLCRWDISSTLSTGDNSPSFPVPVRSMSVATPIMCIAELTDEGLYAVGGLDGGIHLCLLGPEGSEGGSGGVRGAVQRVEAHSGSVRAVSVVRRAADHTLLLSGGEDRFLRLWRLDHALLGTVQSLESGDPALTLQAELRDHEDFVKCVCPSEDDKLFVSGSYDFQVKLRSISNLRVV